MKPSCEPPVPGSFGYAVDPSPTLTEEEEEEDENDCVAPFDWTDLIQRIEKPLSTEDKWNALKAVHDHLSLENERARRPSDRASIEDHRIERCLCLQVMKSKPDPSQIESLVLILESLVLLWREQSTRQQKKEARVRGLELLPYLLAIWKVAPRLDSRISLALLSIFRSWAKAHDPMARSLLFKAGMIPSVSTIFDDKEANLPLWPQSLGFMKDLLFRAKATEKDAMYQEWMDHVLYALPNDECTEAATACLWNWAVEEHIALSMATDVRLWATLELCQPTFSSPGAQRNTLSTVGNILSMCTSDLDEAPDPIVAHSAWAIEFVLQHLEGTAGDCRRRAMRTIRCLSACPWGREILQEHMGNANGLLQRLTPVFVNREEQEDTRIQCCQALHNWLPHLHDNWSHAGPYVERSLLKIIQDHTSTDKIVMHSMQALTTCFEFSPWKRGPGFLSEEFFLRIYTVLKDHVSDQEYHDIVVALLSQIARKTNHEANQSVLANVTVFDILALLLSEFDKSTDKVVETIESAVKHEAVKKFCVGHDTLLTNLVNVCILSSGERKAAAKALLVSLVSDL